MAAQRVLARRAQLPVVPHAGGRGGHADRRPCSGQPRKGLARHAFVGGNAFMLRMLNRYRDELAVAALPEELDEAVRQTVLQSRRRRRAARHRGARRPVRRATERRRRRPEPDRPQAADRLSLAPRVAARHGPGSSRTAGVRVRARWPRPGRSRGTTTTPIRRGSSRTTPRSASPIRCRSTSR